MKKIFLSIVATVLLSTLAVYADNGKKIAKKQATKKECTMTDCKDKAKCHKATCSMPGCVCH